MQGFVKHVVRSPLAPSTVESIASRTFEHIAARAETSKLTGDLKQRSSGLDPIEIIIILGTFVCVFFLLVLVGTLCKVFNRPSKEAQPYYGGNGLYHPSAAGYGGQGPGSQAAARAAAAGAGGPGSSTNLLSVEQKYNARASLLGAASPMGAGGSGASPQLDDSFGDSSTNSADDYFGMRKPSAVAGPSSHAGAHGRNASSQLGHSRGESSGIRLPGPSAARRHGGGNSGQHPAMPSGAPSPDGGGFRPGQVVVPAGYGSQGPGGPAPQMRAAPRGPPPATDARRRSKYARADGRRIDSVGPGVLRKSMFLASDDGPTDAAAQRMSAYNGGSRVQRQASGASDGAGASNTTSGGLRRVDSVGRGDARRRSQAYPAGAGASGRSPSMYGALANDRAMMRSAQADNFGAGRNAAPPAGRTDPLGAARNNVEYEVVASRNGEQPRGNPEYEVMAEPRSAGPPGAALKAGPRLPKAQAQYAQQASYASSGAGQEQMYQQAPQLGIAPQGMRAVPRAMGPPSPGIAPGMRGYPHQQQQHGAPLAAGGGRQLL